MAVEKRDRIPVVSREGHRLLGIVTRYDLLTPYTHTHDEELLRERVFRGTAGRPDAGDRLRADM
jgi:hypothetical protein